jgi:hypothetical protein
MKTGALQNKKTIGSIVGVIIGTLICIVLPHPWIGVVVGVATGALFGYSASWKDGARRGEITGSLVILLAGFVIIPSKVRQSGFAFWDSFFFYLILGVLGSAMVGGAIGTVISWIREAVLATNDTENKVQ